MRSTARSSSPVLLVDVDYARQQSKLEEEKVVATQQQETLDQVGYAREHDAKREHQEPGRRLMGFLRQPWR